MIGERVAEFEAAVAAGGVVLFPSDTVYGLACGPEDEAAIERLYALKGRPREKSAAVMFFDLDAALTALPELGARTRAALGRLLPGGVTLLLPNPRGRFPLSCLADPQTLGLRVIDVPVLRGARVAVMQSSANPSGGADARTLAAVTPAMRAGVNLEIDGGELPGTPSTIVDLRRYEDGGSGAWSIVRQGAVGEAAVAAALDGQFHFDPASYAAIIRAELPDYERLQDETAAAGGTGARTILELGTGTGVTALRLLERHPQALLTGVDESPAMLAAAAAVLPSARVVLRTARLQDPLPDGPFDLVTSALAVHHLDGAEKADLFTRIRAVLAPGGRFVLGDVVLPESPAEALTPLTDGYDKPSSVAEQLAWLADAGFSASVAWARRDLAVIVAE